MYFDMNNNIDDILLYEKKLINEFKTPFNYMHNPKKCNSITSIYRKNNP